jgi:hypothetical protein
VQVGGSLSITVSVRSALLPHKARSYVVEEVLYIYVIVIIIIIIYCGVGARVHVMTSAHLDDRWSRWLL